MFQAHPKKLDDKFHAFRDEGEKRVGTFCGSKATYVTRVEARVRCGEGHTQPIGRKVNHTGFRVRAFF